ncbi:MAG: ATP-dependent Clp protease adaptor ClpS [Treponema sp.]|jgi:ATP-dependent Clp protease adaptor protein ClpS|nr:ATP-dependent Clp protease adaptor ClpS [Treponema sp.]MBQ1181787.1 ATP-dependent Clp protease adaptor ClpS [Treponema sp.]MBQ1971415.1 ATP-dependent Clp protease adaptor ClpS [Treponema sp.]MBQ2234001.1 ATP-dependent Clp protease adaptor ClpS [Treponema sp.]MBQ5631772.1 ATP-dependent Clp protease adaptor ClpS [Treponema sp.]
MSVDSQELNNSKIEDNAVIELPPECEVIFFNDDYTTKDFVVDILVSVFNKDEQTATDLMELVHNSGSAIVGTYTYDIAVTRASIATTRAKKNEFPLRIEVRKK